MSSFLKKGKRQEQKDIDKKVAKVQDMFHKTLIAMNHVFTNLKDDPELTSENFEQKVKELTQWKFSEKQLNILKRDLIEQYETEDHLE